MTDGLRELEALIEAIYLLCPACKDEGVGSVNGSNEHVDSHQLCRMPRVLNLALWRYETAIKTIEGESK